MLVTIFLQWEDLILWDTHSIKDENESERLDWNMFGADHGLSQFDLVPPVPWNRNPRSLLLLPQPLRFASLSLSATNMCVRKVFTVSTAIEFQQLRGPRPKQSDSRSCCSLQRLPRRFGRFKPKYRTFMALEITFHPMCTT